MSRRTITLLAASAAMAPPLARAQDARTIQVATHYSEEQAAPLLACFDAYEAEHPGVTVEHQQTAYCDFLQTILTSRVGGTAPDIYNIYSIWAPQLVSAGVLEPPPAEVADYITTSYSPATVGAATIAGQLWGYPTEVVTHLEAVASTLRDEVEEHCPPFDDATPTRWLTLLGRTATA